jgi:NAD(P)H-dependent FMN reductase
VSGTVPAARRLLVVHHTPSPALQAVLEAVREGAAMVDDVELVVRPALSAGAADLLAADGVLLGTPANIGYLSGAMKHFFDGVYYPTLTAKTGAPYGLYVHGGSDATGAVRAVEAIAKGLGWVPARPPVIVLGAPTKHDIEAVWDLAATVAATAGGLAG